MDLQTLVLSSAYFQPHPVRKVERHHRCTQSLFGRSTCHPTSPPTAAVQPRDPQAPLGVAKFIRIRTAETAPDEAAPAEDEVVAAEGKAVTAVEKAKAAMEQAKTMAIGARHEALAWKEQALKDKREAIAAKEQALEISERI